ncbi:DNA repair protein RecN [Actinomycetospora lemnae]|uniref:DNA repair protein RecN n=1 Tax=Actinomycetospora lemnae TaxID=3019891 RepID=A0ABT5T2Q5_9PSEU|nr:DNA repair protein RecN [Actinomycetospora sp. DW7H6]MDD7969405.1 DNA repair protein RecN [Actinomycetospora sp. DW7H6]
MLSELRIQGLGVIEDATLDLHPGLTVVTGETGAGKTMVVTGLHLLGGGRADSSRVRRGASRATVEGRFLLPPAPDADDEGGAGAEGEDGTDVGDAGDAGDGPPRSALRLAADAGAALDDDGSLIAARTVSADGRSRAHLGGRSVPMAVLGDVTDAALAVHGQHEALRLLRSAEQRAVLDRFAGAAVAEPLAAYRRTRTAWRRAVTELARRREQARELSREADMLRHGLTEIESVDPQPGEDAELVAEARRLADADDLRATAAGALAALAGPPDGTGEEPDAVGLLGEARRRVQGNDDPVLAGLDPRLAEAAALIGDAAAELTDYLERLEADPQRLEQVLARQSALKGLTRKYAADVDGVLAWADAARERLTGLDTSDEALAALAVEAEQLASELAGHAARVSAARREAADRFGAAVSAELDGLAMGAASVQLAVRVKEAAPTDAAALEVDGARVVAGPDGVDEVELLLTPHAGAPALPVHKGASGGELSRVMLAVEVVLAGADTTPTLVFDEVDAGVGGRAAVEVGRRLARLAATHQVVVVTHLAQVAAYADRHLVVDKGGLADVAATDGVTRSAVRTLDDAERTVELARMLAGTEETETGRAHAEELLAAAAADRAGSGSDAPTPISRGAATRRSGSRRSRRAG